MDWLNSFGSDHKYIVYLFLTVTRELTQFVGSSYLLITFALISLLKVPFNLGDAVGGTFLGG